MKIFKILLLVACVVIPLAAIGLSVFHVPTEFDDRTHCKLDHDDRAVTYILLDQSDEFARSDKEKIKDSVHKIIDSLGDDAKLVVLEINPSDPFNPNVLFERCALHLNGQWWAAFLEKKSRIVNAKKLFLDDFLRSTSDAFDRKSLPKSPIIEAIYYVSDRDDFKSSLSKQIYIVSDLFQNYGRLKFKNKIPSANDPIEDYIGSDPIALNNCKVYFLFATRRGSWEARKPIRSFWESWIKSRGASVSWTLIHIDE